MTWAQRGLRRFVLGAGWLTWLAQFALFAFALFGAAACDPGSSLDDSATTVARVGGHPIALEDIRVAAALTSDDDRRAAVDSAIDVYLASEEARRRGLGFTEATVGRIARIRRDAQLRERRVLREALYAVVEWEVEIDEAELREYYEKGKALYGPRLVTLRSAVFGGEVAALREVRRLDAGAMLDPQHSKDIGPVSIRGLPRALRAVAKELSVVGEHATIELGKRWTIIQLLEDERGDPPQFSEVRDGIEKNRRARRARERFAEELASLRAATDVEILESVIAHDPYWTVEAPPTDGDGDTGRPTP